MTRITVPDSTGPSIEMSGTSSVDLQFPPYGALHQLFSSGRKAVVAQRNRVLLSLSNSPADFHELAHYGQKNDNAKVQKNRNRPTDYLKRSLR